MLSACIVCTCTPPSPLLSPHSPLLSPHQRYIITDESADAVEDNRKEEPSADEGPIKVWGNIPGFIERLDDELFKGLQVCCCCCCYDGCGCFVCVWVAVDV